MPEWRSCIVFTPDSPALFLLNLNAWLILLMCDGKSLTALRRDYVETVGPKLGEAEAERHLASALAALRRAKIIEWTDLSEASAP